MTGRLTLEELERLAASGRIDTVICGAPDMQGRFMGKRFTARHFLDHGREETHCCNYLLACDMEMTTVPGYAVTSWAKGYGDYVQKPDLSTLRVAGWTASSALVIADLFDHHGHPVAHAPRTMLRKQIDRLAALGFGTAAATELEFFLFKESFEDLAARKWREPTPISPYNEDYHLWQTAKEEGVMRPLRNGLMASGVHVENTKGEAEAGQHEINIRYSDALGAADDHLIVKQAVKEVAWAHGHAATFMAKYDHRAAGSSAHVHMSLTKAGAPAFFDRAAPHGMSATMRAFLGGLLAHAAEATFFLAPFVNSYKRFCVGMFAPTRIVWSRDNRTAGFRVVGEETGGVRMECRIGGADLNPYLALAALLACGIDGIERRLDPGPEFRGDAYAGDAPRIPPTLREATALLEGSAMLRAAMGDGVIDHYVRCARWEQEDFDAKVTDYERIRGFERA